MTRLDWHIFRKFLATFFFSLILFTAIAIAVDSSEHTEDFLNSGLTTRQIIEQYYIGFVPYIWGLLFPLFVFISVIYFTSRMAMRSEIIAILASGTSFNRFLRPFFLAGIFLAILLFVANRHIIPKGNEIRGDFQLKYVDKFDYYKSKDYSHTFYRRSDTNSYVGIRFYDTLQKSAGGFFLHRINDNHVIYNLRSDGMKWDTSRNKWLLTKVMERTLKPEGEEIVTHDSLYIGLNIKPSDLRWDYYLKDKLSTPALIDFITKEELRGTEGLNTLKVERYRRSATAYSVILLAFIGVVIASRKTRGGSGLHLALGFIVAALFILSDKFSTTFSVKGNFSPLIAAWIPNLIFTAVAFWLYRKAPK